MPIGTETRVAAGDPPDPLEQAILAALGRPGAGWAAASALARQLGRPRREVDAVLAVLAARGVLTRQIDRIDDGIFVSWRFKLGSR